MFLIQICCREPSQFPRILPRWTAVQAATMEDAVLVRLRGTREGTLKRVLRRRAGRQLYAVVAPAGLPRHPVTGQPLIVQGFALRLSAISDPSLN